MENLDLFGMIMAFLDAVSPFIPVKILAGIGGASILASAVASKDSQYDLKAKIIANKVLNLAAFNFGRASNK